MRNSTFTPDANRAGHSSARDAQLIFHQAADRHAAACTFDKCTLLEIKDSALFLEIADSDIKDIKRSRTLISPPIGGYDHG